MRPARTAAACATVARAPSGSVRAALLAARTAPAMARASPTLTTAPARPSSQHCWLSTAPPTATQSQGPRRTCSSTTRGERPAWPLFGIRAAWQAAHRHPRRQVTGTSYRSCLSSVLNLYSVHTPQLISLDKRCIEPYRGFALRLISKRVPFFPQLRGGSKRTHGMHVFSQTLLPTGGS